MRTKNLDKDAQEKLAKECFQNSKFDEALIHFQNILKTDKKHINLKETANYLNNIGLCYMQLNSYQPALENLQAALEIYEKKKLENRIAGTSQYIGLTHFWMGNYEQALNYYTKSYNFYDKDSDTLKYSSLLNMIGMLKKELGDLSGALDYSLRSLKIKETLGDKKAIAIALINIGAIYFELENIKKAKDYYSKALNYYEEINNEHGIASTLTNLGNVYNRFNKYKKALDYYQQSLKISEKLNDTFTKASNLNNIGGVYSNLQDFSKALEFYQKALQIKEELGNKEGIIICLRNVSNTLLKTGSFQEALEIITKSQELAIEINHKHHKCTNYKIFSEIYEEIGKYKKVTENLKLHLKLKDELYNEENQKIIAELQTKYETEKKEKEAEIFRLKTIELEKKNTQIEQQKQELSDTIEKLRKSEIKYDIAENELHKNIGLDFVGESEGIVKIKKLISVVALSENTNVLITGESGTGKEVIARKIHNLSNRKSNSFYGVNSSAIPETLFESEFFGHEKNAFTGANKTHIGWFEIANGGTLFLDEIGTMQLDRQVKLLRVLEERKIVRLGSHKEIPIDVHIISATNTNLYELVNKNEFREDLYHRLSTFVIQIPPLRQRKEDIPLLLEHFVKMYSKILNKKMKKIEKPVETALLAYDFPGNVRELKNIIERAVIVSDSSTLKYKHFIIPGNDLSREQYKDIIPLAQLEKNYILKALQTTGFNQKKAAELLGVERKVIARRIIKFGIKKEIN